MFNKKSYVLGILFVSTFLALTSTSLAQNNLQTGQSLQNQTDNTQNTGSLGSTGSTNQNSNADVNTVRPQNLDVIGNPDQNDPSVSVGQTTTKTETVSSTPADESNWTLTIIIVLGLLVIFWAVLKFSKKTEPSQEVIEIEKTLKLEQVDPKIQSKLSTKTSQKAKSKSPTKKKSSKKPKKKK